MRSRRSLEGRPVAETWGWGFLVHYCDEECVGSQVRWHMFNGNETLHGGCVAWFVLGWLTRKFCCISLLSMSNVFLWMFVGAHRWHWQLFAWLGSKDLRWAWRNLSMWSTILQSACKSTLTISCANLTTRHRGDKIRLVNTTLTLDARAHSVRTEVFVWWPFEIFLMLKKRIRFGMTHIIA